MYNEIQSGGVVFIDEAYTAWGAKTFSSLFLKSSVTSRPNPRRIITDLGWKTLSGLIVNQKPVHLNNFESVSKSSEHRVIQLSQNDITVKVGNQSK